MTAWVRNDITINLDKLLSMELKRHGTINNVKWYVVFHFELGYQVESEDLLEDEARLLIDKVEEMMNREA